MRVLIVGAGGMIGGALADALEARGLIVCRAARRGAADIHLDMTRLPEPEVLVEMLRGWDVVVNATGLGPVYSEVAHRAVHLDGACRVFDACVVAGVPRVVQVSALGDVKTGSFIATKHQADDYLMSLPIEARIARPSLVFSLRGESSRLLAGLAQLPFAFLPDSGAGRVQPVHLDDLVLLLVYLVRAPTLPHECIVELGGPRRIAMAEFIRILGRAITGRAPRVLALPKPFAAIGATLFKWFGSSLGGSQTQRVLTAGSTTQQNGFADLFGRLPRDPMHFLTPDEAARCRSDFIRMACVGIGRVALAFVCLASAALPIVRPEIFSEVTQPMTLLQSIGLEGEAARWAYYAMLALNLVCVGLALTARSCLAWSTLAAVLVGYSVGLGLAIPRLWLDPFGPLLQNLPILAWIAALALLTHKQEGNSNEH